MKEEKTQQIQLALQLPALRQSWSGRRLSPKQA